MSIHIKPENKGKFNATKKRTGKTTEELTHSKNPLTRKRAIFAQNAKKWKHADGGKMFVPDILIKLCQSGGNIEDGVKNVLLKHIMARVPSGEVSPREWRMVERWAPEVYNAFTVFNEDLTKPKVDEVKRRLYRQRYAESNFNDRAVSSAGAIGAFQIMPITYKDYLTRGKGKPGDLYDYNYNKQVRDWALDQAVKDLQSYYSDQDTSQVQLAKRYAAYNWGAGNLRKHLKAAQQAGLDTTTSLDWVGWGKMPKETTDYVNWVVLEKDIPKSSKNVTEYQKALQKNNITVDRFGGRLKRR